MSLFRLVAFDLDDTLAESKSQISPEMAALLGQLAEVVETCIISGGRFSQFEKQVLQHLDLSKNARAQMHLMPTCGTQYYRWAAHGWSTVYSEDLSDQEKERIMSALSRAARSLGYWQDRVWGDVIEDRGSQITFSALGQAAPADLKYAWDPDGKKKQAIRDHAAKDLPDLEVRSGGSTSIDVTRKGVDKAYGMRKLMEELDLKLNDVLFVGDRLDEGGNDYPIKAMGIECLEVSDWRVTADIVRRLLRDSRCGTVSLAN